MRELVQPLRQRVLANVHYRHNVADRALKACGAVCVGWVGVSGMSSAYGAAGQLGNCALP